MTDEQKKTFVDALMAYQQADMDGTISRQAIHAIVDLIEQLQAEVERLRAELADARIIAGCAYQSWKGNCFDVAGNQKALLALHLKEGRQDAD